MIDIKIRTHCFGCDEEQICKVNEKGLIICNACDGYVGKVLSIRNRVIDNSDVFLELEKANTKGDE